jgi:TctA family transporter
MIGTFPIFGGIIILFAILWLAIIGLAVFAFVFWILMLIDCAQRNFKKDNDKIVWVLIIIFTGIIGAIIYYCLVKRKDKK